MYYIRRMLIGLVLINLLFLALYDIAPLLLSEIGTIKVDDWQYLSDGGAAESDPIAPLRSMPWYLFALFLTIEGIRYIIVNSRSISHLLQYAFVLLVCLVLFSIGGPMIGSITDQGYHDYGFSVGGAKDINSFRANIAAGYLPQPSDITYEGLFYDYHFVTGQETASSSPASPRLFAPSWSTALSHDPQTGQPGHFLAVGLKSQLSAKEFARKKLNLVVVLDISGSMSSPFNSYYYGTTRRYPGMNKETAKMTKLQAACSALVAMLDHLRPDDRLGIALFNHRAHLAKPVSTVGSTDLEALKKHILALEDCGATNMEEGLEMGRSMLSGFSLCNPDEYENRIIFMTDAMPNTDDTSESGLLDLTNNMARNRVYLTFIGMGVDFNAQLVRSITRIRGANYYSVHSPGDFTRRLADEFACMVNPMVFDLALTLKAPGRKILKVIGSPEADYASGRIMHVKTLFPAPATAEGTRGGIILLQLDGPLGKDAALTISYEDRAGQYEEFTDTLNCVIPENEFYSDNGIRKGILLMRYADMLTIAATEKHQRIGPADEQNDGSGWSYWERPGRSLQLTASARADIAAFRDYFSRESAIIGDQALQKELLLLGQLARLEQSNP